MYHLKIAAYKCTCTPLLGKTLHKQHLYLCINSWHAHTPCIVVNFFYAATTHKKTEKFSCVSINCQGNSFWKALSGICLCVTHKGDMNPANNWLLCSSLQHFIVSSMMDLRLLSFKSYFFLQF